MRRRLSVPYGQLYAFAREKIPRTFAHSVGLFYKIVVSSLVYTLCVHRRWSIERHRNSIDFAREGGCGSPYLVAPPISACVQNRVEFVELARDMSSNCTRSHWDYKLEREQAAWYQRYHYSIYRAPGHHLCLLRTGITYQWYV